MTKIEKNVPIPSNRLNLLDEYKLLDMGVDESVKFPIEYRSQMSVIASQQKKRRGREFTIRKINDNFCRIWRVK